MGGAALLDAKNERRLTTTDSFESYCAFHRLTRVVRRFVVLSVAR